MRILPTTDARALTIEQHRQLEVLFDAILPGAPDAPGATDAGAADYVDHLLATPDEVYYEIARWKVLYATALPALDTAARERFATSLAELDRAPATALLSALANGELTGLPPDVDGKRLFATLRGHCVEGCFADARWGGNRDRMLWRWTGYQEPPREMRRNGDGALEDVGSSTVEEEVVGGRA